MSSGLYRSAAAQALVSLLFGAQGARSAEAPKPPVFRQVATAGELTEAVKEMAGVGGTVVLLPGTYTITETLRFERTNHCNVVGSGWNTTIRRRGAGDALVFANCGFCTVRNLMVVADEDAGSGSGIVFRERSSSNRVDFCRIASFPLNGIRFEGDPKSPQSSNTVSDCHFINNAQDQLYSFHSNDFFYLGNQFGAHGKTGPTAPRTGARLDHSSAGTYTRNYHWGNRVALRLGPGSHYNRVGNNRFENSYESGVVIGDPAGGTSSVLNILIGNTIHTNSEERSGAFPAVAAYDAADTTFCTNQVFSWNSKAMRHRHSLVLGRGCRNWIVKDNILRHNSERSLVYDETAGHLVKGNLMD